MSYAIEARASRLCDAGRQPREHRVDKVETSMAWSQPVETPEPRNAVSRRWITTARP